MHSARTHGFTMMELLVTMAVVVVILSLAAPSFKDAIERRHLEGAASSIHLGLQRAKSEAIKQNVDVTFDIDTASWCYGIVDNAASCDCTAADCTIDGQVVVVAGAEFDDVTVSSASGSDITFDKVVGLPDASPTFTVTLNGNTRTISVNAAGLIVTN